MKGGVALALGLMRELAPRPSSTARPWSCSSTTRSGAPPFGHIERFAAFDACLCFEAGERTEDGDEAVIVKRKAAGRCGSRLTAAPAHSGSAPHGAATRCWRWPRPPRGWRRAATRTVPTGSRRCRPSCARGTPSTSCRRRAAPLRPARRPARGVRPGAGRDAEEHDGVRLELAGARLAGDGLARGGGRCSPVRRAARPPDRGIGARRRGDASHVAPAGSRSRSTASGRGGGARAARVGERGRSAHAPSWPWRWLRRCSRSDQVASRGPPGHLATTDTLRRTPLHDRHERGREARSVCGLGDAGPVRGHPPEHVSVRTARDVRRLAHGRDRDERPRRRRRSCSGCSRTTSRRSPSAARSTRCSAARTAACSTTCSPTGSGPALLTVTNAANHEKDLAWFRAARRRLDVEVATPTRTGRCSRSRGRRRARRSAARRRGADRAHAHRGARARGRRTARLRHGLHGRGRLRADRARRRRRRLGRALAEGVRPAGLGARDTLRLEVCFHLYGNDLDEEHDPIEAGLGWCCKLDTGFIGAETLAGGRARADARPVRLHRTRHPAPGQRDPHRTATAS